MSVLPLDFGLLFSVYSNQSDQRSILFYSIPYYTIGFYIYILFNAILFYFIGYYAILLYSIIYDSALFYILVCFISCDSLLFSSVFEVFGMVTLAFVLLT